MGKLKDFQAIAESKASLPLPPSTAPAHSPGTSTEQLREVIMHRLEFSSIRNISPLQPRISSDLFCRRLAAQLGRDQRPGRAFQKH